MAGPQSQRQACDARRPSHAVRGQYTPSEARPRRCLPVSRWYPGYGDDLLHDRTLMDALLSVRSEVT